MLLPALTAGLGLMLSGQVAAQTFTTLHGFTALGVPPCNCINGDGALPYAGLVAAGNTLYGTAVLGGSAGVGTVFKLNADGSGFTILHYFTPASGPNPYAATNSDGGEPYGGLILSGNTLYGTAYYGGTSGYGTVFKLNTNGTGFTTLHSFTGDSDGAYPRAGLLLSGNILYGTAYDGSLGYGTVFKVSTNGTGFTNLHSFTAPAGPFSTNGDGANPYAGLILSGSTLFGTAYAGGSSGKGTVFKVNTDGTGFTNLHNFTAVISNTNSDGAHPYAGLILSGNTLYGTAYDGGSSGNGTVFKLNTDGAGFTNLHGFTGGDGAGPAGTLILSGNTLYGTTYGGGSSVWGTVFQFNTDGTGFTTLHSFAGFIGTNGASPTAGVILFGSTLYGTAYQGGSAGNGTVFSLSLSLPQLAITSSGTNVILVWPTNAAGFTLQSATNLVSPAVWGSVSPTPVVINGQNAVTNPVSGSKKFYRLSQ